MTPLAYLSTLTSVLCCSLRTAQVFRPNYEAIDVFSAKFVFPRSSKIWNKALSTHNIVSLNHKDPPFILNTPEKSNLAQSPLTKKEEENNAQLAPPEEIPDADEEEHSPGENTYKIIESQFGAGGIKHDNFYVKNSTNFNLNIASELSQQPDVNIKSTNEPQVLIMHTHTSESYMKRDSGFFYESYYPRSTDKNKNVTRVGDAITQKLTQNGINTIHDVTYHDLPSYNGSYSRSAKTVKANLEKYPSIQVVLDIHRDSLGNRDTGKIKPTFKFNGKKAAQIMIIAGYDKDGSSGFPDWEQNLRFALRLQQKAETMFPGITRPLNFNSVKYNMNLTHGSVLIEVGSDANTIDEATYTGSLLGDALSELLKSLKQ